MTEVKYYTPTQDITDRTKEGIYTAIKSWVQGIATEMFDKWFNISYDDDNSIIMLLPKDENLNTRYLRISTGANTLNIEFPREAIVSSAMSSKAYNLSNTIPRILIYSGKDFFIGDTSTPLFYGLINTKTFDNKTKQYVVGAYNSSYHFYFANTEPVSTAGDIATVSKGLFPEYVLSQFILTKTNTIPQNLVYIDGGLGDIPKGKFKINSHNYFTVFANVAELLD